MKGILKHKIILVFLVFLVLGLAVYANSFDGEFFWDDDDSIVNNIYIKDWKFFPKFFTENLIAGAGQITNYYRPLLLVSFSLDHHLWGLDVVGYHFTNTMIHIFCAWLIFLLFFRISKAVKKPKVGLLASFLAGLFFLIHPLQTEAVSYVAGRADPLSTLFSLISIWFFLNFRGSETGKRSNFFWCLLFFVFGILTKEQVILLPLLFLLVDWVVFTPKLGKKEILGMIRRNLPFLLLSVVYFALHLTILNFKGETSFEYHDQAYDSNVAIRVMTFFSVMLSYLRLLFVPTGLHMAREVDPVTDLFSLKVFVFTLVAIFSALICIKTWKRNRLITFGSLWFLIILLPRTNIISINRPMYEHWLYLPMAGFWLALVSWLYLLVQKIGNRRVKKGVIIILISILMILGSLFSVLTVRRNEDWQDPITFYEKNLQYTPNSFIQHNNLGMAYAEAGRLKEAMVHYKRAMEIKDIYPQVHHNLANAFVSMGKIDEAILEYERALEMSPEFGPSYKKLFDLYMYKEQEDKARELHSRFQRIFKDQ